MKLTPVVPIINIEDINNDEGIIRSPFLLKKNKINVVHKHGRGGVARHLLFPSGQEGEEEGDRKRNRFYGVSNEGSLLELPRWSILRK